MSGQFWINGTTQATSSTSLWYPGMVAAYGSPPLPSVADKYSEYAYDRDAKLAPIEWLTRQIEDVCRLAAI